MNYTTIANEMLSSLTSAFGGCSQFTYAELASAIVGQVNNGRLENDPDASHIFDALSKAENDYWNRDTLCPDTLRALTAEALTARNWPEKTKAEIASQLSLSL